MTSKTTGIKISGKNTKYSSQHPLMFLFLQSRLLQTVVLFCSVVTDASPNLDLLQSSVSIVYFRVLIGSLKIGRASCRERV